MIPLTKIQRYTNNDLFVNFVSRIKSVNPDIWLKEGGCEEPSVAPEGDISNKNVCYLEALQHLGITKNNTEQINKFETAPCPPGTFHSN